MLTPQENLCLHLQPLVMLQHVNPQVDDTGKSQLSPKSKWGPDATLLINWLSVKPCSAHASRELCAGQEGRQYSWLMQCFGIWMRRVAGFRHREFSCLCPCQSLHGTQSHAGTIPGSNAALLHRNELQHEALGRSALGGPCWAQEQHLLLEWPWEHIDGREGCTIRHTLLCGEKEHWAISPRGSTALAQEKAASPHIPCVQQAPFHIVKVSTSSCFLTPT